MKRSGRFIAGIVAGSLAFAPTAFAQQKKPKPKAAATATADASASDSLAQAKKHYGDGDTKYKAGDYAGALTDFQAADAIKPTPQSARYIGLCQDNLGHFTDAVASYQRFLANVPPKMAVQGDEIKARVTAIQALPGKLHVTSDPPGAGVAVDGKPQPNPTPTDVELPPGHHTLHFSAQGHDPTDKDVDVAYASKQDVAVMLAVSAAAPIVPAPVAAAPATIEPTPAPDTPPPAHHSNVAAWITGGAAVVAVGVGTAFGVMALNDKSNFNANPTTATADSGENHALIADMAFGVAVTLGVTSAVLFLSKDDAPATPPATASASAKKRAAITITPAPYVTPHGGGAGALIRF